MGSDPSDLRHRQTQPSLRSRQRPPPKPNRPRAVPAVDEDETTIRVLLKERVEAPAPAPDPVMPVPAPGPVTPAPAPSPFPAIPPLLPDTSRAGEQTPAGGLEVPMAEGAPRSLGSRQLAKLGAAIFAAGVLVGVVVSRAVMTTPASETAEASTSSAPAATAPRPAAPAVATTPVERARNVGSREVEEARGTGRRVDGPAREPASALISSSSAPSCLHLLGAAFTERDDPVAAQRETRIANRELVRGNVAEAQAAYCKAFAWDRTNVDRHVNLARVFLVRRDWQKAADYAERALELDPKSRSALGAVGDAWAALHKTTEARAAWLALEKKSKPSPSEISAIVRRNMALAWRVERLKDFSLAERIYRRVLLFSPDHPGATKGIASCLQKAGDHRAAEAWARRADTLRRRG